MTKRRSMRAHDPQQESQTVKSDDSKEKVLVGGDDMTIQPVWFSV